MSQSPADNPFHGSAQVPHDPSVGSAQGDATGGLIPYKNMYALVAYYLAVFSLIPCIGFFTGVAAVVLGIIGLQKRKANPAIKGTAHAWVGIVLGGVCALGYGTLMLLAIVAGLSNR